MIDISKKVIGNHKKKIDTYSNFVKENKHMLGTLPPQQIEEVLKTQILGRLGCCYNGETYIVPISYAYDGTFIYCHTHEGKKAEMLRKNPKVCFEVDELKDMSNWKSVITQGIFEEIKGRKERNAAMQTLLNRYLPIMSSITTHLGEHWPFHPDDITDIKGIVFRIAIKEKSGRFELNEHTPNMAG